MQRKTKVVCPVCDRLVSLDGTTNGSGELIMPWHIRTLWKRCEGSYRSMNAVSRLGEKVKRPGVRGDAR